MHPHQASTPDYLIVGHVAKDLLPDGRGSMPGGTAIYSAIAACRLGMRVAIVTACAPEDGHLLDPAREAGILVHAVPSPQTTTFLNTYDAEGNRTQVIAAQARTLEFEDIPEDWRGAPVVHLGPIAQELPSSLPGQFRACLLGLTPQGWMRSWDEAGHVQHTAWPVPEAVRLAPPNAVVVMSIEDMGGDPSLVHRYRGAMNPSVTVVLTNSARPADVHTPHGVIPVPAFHAQMVDPTGAGDVFAAALLVRLRETGDPLEATRFAHAAAAFAIEGKGTLTIPARKQVLERMGAA